jgi:hypothetical protein
MGGVITITITNGPSSVPVEVSTVDWTRTKNQKGEVHGIYQPGDKKTVSYEADKSFFGGGAAHESRLAFKIQEVGDVVIHDGPKTKTTKRKPFYEFGFIAPMGIDSSWKPALNGPVHRDLGEGNTPLGVNMGGNGETTAEVTIFLSKGPATPVDG